uniref:Uncharacterized protein n=1 Tax=Arcella intermedia TaxID=1963864 RepID=A0A6B2LCS1_9EUKA
MRQNIKVLDLSELCIPDSCIPLIQKSLDINTSIKSLILKKNRIHQESTLRYAQLIENNSSLTSINFEVNDIADSGIIHITKALQKNSYIHTINLAWNDIGDTGAAIIAQFLSKNSTVTSLNLQMNEIGDPGINAISQTLLVNSTLKSLALANNYIKTDGLMSLFKSLKSNSTLTQLTLKDIQNQNKEIIMKLQFLIKENKKYSEKMTETQNWPFSHSNFNKTDQMSIEEVLLVLKSYGIPKDIQVQLLKAYLYSLYYHHMIQHKKYLHHNLSHPFENF